MKSIGQQIVKIVDGDDMKDMDRDDTVDSRPITYGNFMKQEQVDANKELAKIRKAHEVARHQSNQYQRISLYRGLKP